MKKKSGYFGLDEDSDESEQDDEHESWPKDDGNATKTSQSISGESSSDEAKDEDDTSVLHLASGAIVIGGNEKEENSPKQERGGEVLAMSFTILISQPIVGSLGNPSKV